MKKLTKSVTSNPMYIYLIVLAVTSTVGLQTWRSLYNNYAIDVVGINGLQTGVIQAIRELPGFLSLFVVYLLLVVKEHRLSAIAIALMGVGIFFTGVFPTYYGLILTTLLMSIGFHYFEATNQSLVLQNFEHHDAPLVIGRFKSVAAAANVAVGVVIFSVMHFLNDFPLHYLYYVAGTLTVLSGIYSLVRKTDAKEKPKKKKIIFKKKYTLYYLLSLFSGARRQIFVVFAVFMLVERYKFPVEWIAILFVLNNIIGYYLNPLVARAINYFGEKKVLRTEYFSMIFLFLGYAFIDNQWAIAGFYILDHIFFSFAIGLNTYMQKTADPEDIPATVAAGFTINHISAVLVPILGGFLWLINPMYAFLSGVGFAICSLILTKFLPNKVRI